MVFVADATRAVFLSSIGFGFPVDPDVLKAMKESLFLIF